MSRKVIAAAAVVLLVPLLTIGVLAFRGRSPDEAEEPQRPPERVSRNAAGEAVVTLDAETQARIGLKVQTLEAAAAQPEVAAYGRLQEDPARSFTLRAPVSGTLAAPGGRLWPSLGETIADGEAAGRIVPRLAPLDRIALAERLSAARAELTAASATRDAARAAFDRAKILNADGKNVSDRALQEAEAKLKGEEARARAAQETIDMLDSSLKEPAAVPLTVGSGGQVVEVMARPGESIESGQPVLRVARFDRLIARVDVPAGEAASLSARSARLVVAGHGAPIRGERLMVAAAADPGLQGTPLLFRAANPGGILRPGLAVTAYLEAPGERRAGVIVPGSAAVLANGRSWAYVQTAPAEFTRRELSTGQFSGSGWFTSGGFAPGDRVVVAGAQLLLSEESKR